MKNRIMCLCGAIVMMVALSVGVSAQVQKEYSVKGVLTDSVSGEGEPFATVRVYDADSKEQKLVKVEATDIDGNFNILLKSAGKYRATFTVVGKQPAVKEFSLNEANRSIDFGKIYTSVSSAQLGEVVVEAARPLIKADVDKLTYDLEADPETKSNTLIEMLRKVPMVSVDGEENIKVNGKSNFKVLVNGKPNTMMSNNPKDVFRSMPASAVKKIEVVTDPGAKYDAEGVGGVLNIITTDSRMQGYNVNLNARLENRGASGGVFATAQVGKFTVSTNMNYSKSFSQKSRRESIREDYKNDDMHTLITQSRNDDKGNFMFGNIEASYELDSLNLFTLSGNMYGGRFTTNGIADSEMKRLTGDRRYYYKQSNLSSSDFGNINLGLDYQRSFKKKDELLTFSYRLDYSPNGSKGDSRYEDMQDVPYDLRSQRFDNDAHTEEHTVQVDYVNPITDKHYIDFGGKYIYRKNYSDVTKWVAGDDGNMALSDDPMNHYNQLRNIVAAYTDYKFKYGNFGAKAGVRYEYTFMNVKYNLSPDRNYSANMSDVVPSAMLSYKLNQMQTLKLSYTMRINRPGIDYLNPYVDNTNPSSLRFGNPDLDTEKSHSIGLGFNSFSQKLMIDLNLDYEFSNNGIEEYQTLKDGVMSTTYGNVSDSKVLGLGAWINYTPWAKTRLMINFYGAYTDSKSEILGLHSYGFTMNTYGSIQQTLPRDFNVSMYVGGYTKTKDLQYTSPGFLFYGMSVSKSFLKNKRLNVSLRANNPFKKNMTFGQTSNTTDFYYKSTAYTPVRAFGVSVSWRFGDLKTSVKRTERSINNDDVKSGGGSNNGAGASAGAVGGM